MLPSIAYSARELTAPPQAYKHNQEVTAATKQLLKGNIPNLALEIVFLCLKLADDAQTKGDISVQTLHTHLQHILHRMHTSGVNVRFLGAVRCSFLETAKQYDLPTITGIGAVYAALIFTEVGLAHDFCKSTVF